MPSGPTGLASRCPHCQAELPERGRFCVMCGRRIEGWGRVVVAPDINVPVQAVPLPSQHERTRPSPPRDLLARSLHAMDQEALRPTRELPSVGHELRARAPDHRVHTSPTGHALPPEWMSHAAPTKKVEPARLQPRPQEAAPRPVPDDHTDVIRIVRRRPTAQPEGLHLLAMALLCGAVAAVAGMVAYRLLTEPQGGAPVRVPKEAAEVPGPSPGPPGPGSPGARTQPLAQTPLPPGRHRTRDLVVSIPPSPWVLAERRKGPNRPAALPPAGPTTPTMLDPAPAPAPEAATDPPGPAAPGESPREAAPQQPLLQEEQQRETEAQLAAADIEFVASTHNVQVRQCYERAFKQGGGGPGGRVELGFTLSEEGRAVAVSTVANTTGSEVLARCLEQRIAEWRFSRPVGGAKTYQFPFIFLATPAPAASGASGPGAAPERAP